MAAPLQEIRVEYGVFSSASHTNPFVVWETYNLAKLFLADLARRSGTDTSQYVIRARRVAISVWVDNPAVL